MMISIDTGHIMHNTLIFSLQSGTKGKTPPENKQNINYVTFKYFQMNKNEENRVQYLTAQWQSNKSVWYKTFSQHRYSKQARRAVLWLSSWLFYVALLEDQTLFLFHMPLFCCVRFDFPGKSVGQPYKADLKSVHIDFDDYIILTTIFCLCTSPQFIYNYSEMKMQTFNWRSFTQKRVFTI